MDTIKSGSDTEKSEYKPKWGNQYKIEYTKEKIETLADEFLQWFEQETVKKENSEKTERRMWLQDFFIMKRIPRQRMSEFAKINDYFRWAYELCKDIQESRLFKIGLIKGVNVSMPIIALKNFHQWTDKMETRNYSIDFSALSKEQLERIAKGEPIEKVISGSL